MSKISYSVPVKTTSGEMTTLEAFQGNVLLVVNVGSNCGFTPQYEQLQKLYDEYAEQGLQILGFPCNQFGSQAGGSNEAIVEYCSVNYGVTFPVFAKVKVNGGKRHPLYSSLVKATDVHGKAGKVRWNFEKFLVAPGGTIVGRYRSKILPDAPEIVSLIEKLLPVPEPISG